MYEFSPKFFVPVQKKFNFFIFDSEPNFQKTNTKIFAYMMHEKKFGFCENNSVHCNVSAEISKIPDAFKRISSKGYSVTCLYSCFKSLIFSTNMVISGAIIDKIVLVVKYNSRYQSSGCSASRKKIPSFCSMKNKDAQTQAYFIPDCTPDCFLHAYNNVKIAELSKIMDIFTGYGSINTNSSSNEVCFQYDFKKQFLSKHFFC